MANKEALRAAFIEKALHKFGNKFDYSQVKYTGSRNPIIIICPKHGEFQTTSFDFLQSEFGCKKCAYEKRKMPSKLTIEQFIARAQQVHGKKYDYSNVEYVNSSTPITITCPIHGDFKQVPNDHLSGCGCPTCSKRKRVDTAEFIRRARLVHGDKYDYSKVDFKNVHTKIDIICPIHGVFPQYPKAHWRGDGCPKCRNYFEWTTENFIQKAKEVHGDKYDYSKTIIEGRDIKTCIVCPKHGVFWQKPCEHLYGSGCPKCRESHIEREIRLMLEDEHIEYIYQCRKSTLPWILRQTLDFYLPQYNIAIECQGMQHYQPTTFTTDKSKEKRLAFLQKVQERDARKARLCKENGVDLIYYTDQRIPEEFPTFKDKNRLLEYIYRDKT